MSASQSNLSDPKYGYDMVVATTQTAINATMKEWLSKYVGKPFIQAYVFNPETESPIISDFDKLREKLGFDPFEIPEDTPTTDPRFAKLKEEMFMFAFIVEIGLPKFDLDKIPAVIEFNKEGSYVTYNMVCKTFKIIAIEQPTYGKPKWINLDQAKCDAPWVFSFMVDLDMRTDNIHNHMHELPEETQKDIKNLGEDMFSMQQLFLDLNSAGMSDQPLISGLDKQSAAYFYLTTFFIQGYINDIGKTGGVMLGFSVVSKEPFPKNVSVIPTDMNFEICSYRDEAGKPTKDYNAYTLNYLIMAKNNLMPAPVQFTWNWVEKERVREHAGVMAVNRGTFIAFLSHLLSPNLHYTSKQPKVRFHCDCIKSTFYWDFVNDDTVKTYNIVNNGSAHILTYNYSKHDSSSDTTYCGLYGTWGNMSASYSVQSDIFLEATKIRTETTITVHMHLNSMSAVADGNFAKYKATTVYAIGVDEYGSLTVDQAEPQVDDQSESISTSFWSKFISMGQIDGMIEKVKGNIKPMVEKLITNESKNIKQMLNGSRSWVFPGGKTFVFREAAFSDFQDLTSKVLYVEPNATKKEIAILLKQASEEDARMDAEIAKCKQLKSEPA